MKKAVFHLPGLFEFVELYRIFLSIYEEHREYFYDICEIGSIYGAPADCLWGGGRVGFGEDDADGLLKTMESCGISARLTFSNSLLREEHLADRKCNELCRRLAKYPANGVIVHSDILVDYLKKNYPELYLVSSTTKVLTDIEDLKAEADRKDFLFVVPDFRLNKKLILDGILSQKQKDKMELLCNECCMFECTERKKCYESVSRKALGEEDTRQDFVTLSNAPSAMLPEASEPYTKTNNEHVCPSPDSDKGYRFSAAMKNPGFISVEDIRDIYLPKGFSNFKIEGRSLGSAVVFEMLLYYLIKPEYQLLTREAVYLDSSLDLF